MNYIESLEKCENTLKTLSQSVQDYYASILDLVYHKKDLLYDSIRYQEIVEHWDDANWTEWNRVELILVGIPGTKAKMSIEQLITRWVNNYLIETAVAKELNLSFIDYYSHNYFHTGAGIAEPDFKDINNITYELKTIPLANTSPSWWQADKHLYYNKSTKELFIRDKEETEWKLVKYLNIPLKEINYAKN